MLALRLRTAATPLVRLASTARPSPAPKKAPHDKIPFTAPPVDTTKGELAQVYLPDMAPLEQERTVEIKIPSAPDTYSTSSHSADDFPTLHPSPQIITASHPSTYPSGGPSANALGDDVQPGEAGDSRSALPKEQDRSQDGSSSEGRPLGAEEKRGLFKLAGVVAAGWTLSWVTDPARRKKD
ncbi:SPOSA6832_01376 [Sporobolomyces salmonicolor]|uniref:SPOSA6832_01376-mRNA-1:cds n=1 Tax=Sporidiobolus salmonicolor TaxID=5005 RepID=A0A0D6EIG7_SPOSA|nr:SPOSA6832_01376 [Sporobolomyces salmonicolor]